MSKLIFEESRRGRRGYAYPELDVPQKEAADSLGLAAGNPLSFLHVSRAEIDLPPDTNPYADAVYAKAVANFTALRSSMVEEVVPSVYFYRLRMGTHAQTGLAACYSVDEYNRDVIKKHEKTRKDKEDDRTRHIIDLRAQTGPVFLTYRHSATVDGIARRVCAGAPLYDIVAPDGVTHTLWRADEAATGELVDAFGALPALYIADGHHCAASAARAHDRFRGTRSAGNATAGPGVPVWAIGTGLRRPGSIRGVRCQGVIPGLPAPGVSTGWRRDVYPRRERAGLCDELRL